MVAGGAQDLDARVDRAQSFGRRVLAPEGADRAPPFASVGEGGPVAEARPGRWCRGAATA